LEGATDTLGEATDAVEETLEEATDTLGEAAGAVEETLEGATDTLGETTDAVEGTASVSTPELPEVPTETAPLPDDLTAIQGIGPRVAESLIEGGIDSYEKLAATTPEDLAQALKRKIPKHGGLGHPGPQVSG
ncbi:DUF4332 domain-containing protein, partial [Candidatus Thiosymbion oneisti]